MVKDGHAVTLISTYPYIITHINGIVVNIVEINR